MYTAAGFVHPIFLDLLLVTQLLALAPDAAAATAANSSSSSSSSPWSAASVAAAKQMLARMNHSEKITMLHGTGPKVVPGGVGYVQPNERLSIPALILANGPQGWGPWTGEKGNSTCWPSGLTVAATWDAELAERWGVAMGTEFFEKGTNVQLGPGLCVNRVPNCGRAFEYLSGEVSIRPSYHSTRILGTPI
jgi:beta-glucosidase